MIRSSDVPTISKISIYTYSNSPKERKIQLKEMSKVFLRIATVEAVHSFRYKKQCSNHFIIYCSDCSEPSFLSTSDNDDDYSKGEDNGCG